MKMWKAAVLVTGLLISAGLGAAFAPAAAGQTITAWHSDQGGDWLFLGGGQIGVSIRDVDEADAKAGKQAVQPGVLIEDVTIGGPADTAGMKTGDIVVEYDGEKVRSARQFTRLVQETAAGRKVPVVVLRNGQRTTLTIEPKTGDRYRTLGNLGVLRDWDSLTRRFDFDLPARPVPPTPPTPPTPPRAPAFPDIDGLLWRMSGITIGLTVSDLSTQLADYFGTKDGVLVTSVVQDSAAGRAGLKAGDVITAVNGSDVVNPSDFRRRLQRLEAGDEFTLSIVRDKKPTTIKGKVEEARARRRTFRSHI